MRWWHHGRMDWWANEGHTEWKTCLRKRMHITFNIAKVAVLLIVQPSFSIVSICTSHLTCIAIRCQLLLIIYIIYIRQHVQFKLSFFLVLVSLSSFFILFLPPCVVRWWRCVHSRVDHKRLNSLRSYWSSLQIEVCSYATVQERAGLHARCETRTFHSISFALTKILPFRSKLSAFSRGHHHKYKNRWSNIS